MRKAQVSVSIVKKNHDYHNGPAKLIASVEIVITDGDSYCTRRMGGQVLCQVRREGRGQVLRPRVPRRQEAFDRESPSPGRQPSPLLGPGWTQQVEPERSRPLGTATDAGGVMGLHGARVRGQHRGRAEHRGRAGRQEEGRVMEHGRQRPQVLVEAARALKTLPQPRAREEIHIEGIPYPKPLWDVAEPFATPAPVGVERSGGQADARRRLSVATRNTSVFLQHATG